MIKKIWSTLFIVVLLAGASLPLAAAEDDGATPLVFDVVNAESANTYWTKARMAKAKPYPMPTFSVSADQVTEGMLALTNYNEELVVVAGSKGNTTRAARQAYEDALYSPMATFYNYPPPFNSYKVGNTVRYPNRAVGKLYFNQGGGSYVCSASVVQKNALLTAGHCLSNGRGGLSKNIKFVPAKKGAKKPFGTWACGKIAIPKAYHNGANIEYDYAFCKVKKNNLSESISKYTGWLGMAWGGPMLKLWNSFGYPAAPPFNGQTQHSCQGSLSSTVNFYSGGYDNIGMGCDQTGGSSGGPWIWRFKRPGANYANGVNSFKVIVNGQLRKKEMFSPYFSSDLANFYKIIKNW